MAEILIVDDERALRESLGMVLAGEGHAVRTAHDGEEALRLISEKRPDLVLLDVMMPKLNGFRTCEEIRKADGLLSVIFLTAKDSEADQVRGMGLGADDYVSKEASDAVLLARIGRALERSARIGATLAEGGAEMIRLGAVTVDTKRLVVRESDQEIARLTPTEAGILKLLDSARGRPFSMDDHRRAARRGLCLRGCAHLHACVEPAPQARRCRCDGRERPRCRLQFGQVNDCAPSRRNNLV